MQGTLLRTAVALGWDACFLLPGCCDPFNDKALKAGRGAAFKLPIEEGTWEQLQLLLQKHNMQCYGAGPSQPSENLTGGQITEQHLSAMSRPLCVVLGNEGQGLSDTARQHSVPLAIPMSGPMDSLNVFQAGAILMFALSEHALQVYQQLGRQK